MQQLSFKSWAGVFPNFQLIKSTQLSCNYYFLSHFLTIGLFYACLFCCLGFILITMDQCHGMSNIFKTATTIPSIITKLLGKQQYTSSVLLRTYTNTHCIFTQIQHHFPSDHRKNNRKAFLVIERRVGFLITRALKISWWRSQLSSSYMHFLLLFWEKRDRMGFSLSNSFLPILFPIEFSKNQQKTCPCAYNRR